MGIGVSYTGHGGKRRDFSLEGVPKPGEAADRLLGDTTSRVREALAMIPQHREKERGADGVKVHPRGSVKDSREGICLKGEEFRPPKDDEIYSVVKGERGFHRLKDIDPAVQAARLGDTGVGGDSADSNKAGEDDAVMWQTLSRLARETDNQGGLWLCQYERDVCKTKAGRVVSVSEERKTVVCELPQGGGGDTPADPPPPPFAVRWADSEELPSGSIATPGEYIIYLPTTGLVKVGATDVDITSALSAVGSPYPSGWYLLRTQQGQPIISHANGGTLYLNITNATGSFTSSAVSSSIKIATASVDSTTGARTVKQFARSLIIVGSSSGLPSVFDIVEDSQTCGVSTYKFENQYYEVSGVLYDLNSNYTFTRLSVADLYLAIVLSSVTTPQAYIEEYLTFEDMQADMADETKSVIPLYKFDSEGAVACDLRHIPRADMWTLGGIELPSGGAAS